MVVHHFGPTDAELASVLRYLVRLADLPENCRVIYDRMPDRRLTRP